jgi:hypothetical protein
MRSAAKDGWMKDYRDSFRTHEAARQYDEDIYRSGGHDAFLDNLQRHTLPPLVTAYFEGRRPIQHDFACGTGRSIEMFAGVTTEAHGYDVSPEMLARAQRRCPTAHFHTPDKHQKFVNKDGDRLLTAFRFVLNAPSEARQAFGRWVAEAGEGSGRVLLLLDNHGNSRSIRTFAALYRRRRTERFNIMSSREVTRLLDNHGFRVIGRQGFGVLPRSLHRIRILSSFAQGVDRWASRQQWLAPVSIDVVYLAVPVATAAA